MSIPSHQLAPSYYGFIESTYDALMLFEACITGQLNLVARRPHDREREYVIRSGNIFIYEEATSGIKRWTDGISWSPSRILGNFLIYRQLQKPFGPGEKKKAIRKPKGAAGVTKNTSQSSGRMKDALLQVYGNPDASNGAYGDAMRLDPDLERALIGSLVDSYDFMDDGLVKKTISITFKNVTQHLVSYYSMSDAASRKLPIPSKDPKLSMIQPRGELVMKQNFRGPVDEIDPLDRMVCGRNRYDMTNQSMVGEPLPFMLQQVSHEQVPRYHPQPSPPQSQHGSLYSNSYASVASTKPYDSAAPAYTGLHSYNTQYPPTPGIYAVAPTNHYQSETWTPHRQSVSSAGSENSRMSMAVLQDRRHSSAYTQQSPALGPTAAPELPLTPSQTSESYYARAREPATTPHSMVNSTASLSHRSLPAPLFADPYRHSAYEKVTSYTPTHYQPSSDIKDTPWQMNGNMSVGHAHYQHWPTAATM